MWRFAAASTIGTSHLRSGAPCQDSNACRLIETKGDILLVAVISDGAGSATRAEVGSQLATKTIIEEIEKYFMQGGNLSALTRDTAAGWIESLLEAISERAATECEPLPEFSCTLLGAIVGSQTAAFFQIGDGAIVVSHGEADGWSYLFWPQHGEFANTTNFVTSPNALEVLEIEVAERRIDELALFTDGIENLVLHHPTKSVHAPFFTQMIRPVRGSPARGFDERLSEGLDRYLANPGICDRTDDDKTLILATRITDAPSSLVQES